VPLAPQPPVYGAPTPAGYDPYAPQGQYAGQPPAGAYAPPGGPYAGQPPLPQPVKKSKKRVALIAGGTAVALALAGGGFFAVRALTGAAGGAGSPEEAAQELFESIAALDFEALASHVAPSERTLVSRLANAWSNADAEEEIDQDIKDAWNAIKESLTIELTDMEFSEEELVEGVNRTVLEHASLDLDADTAALAGAIMDLIDAWDEASGGALFEVEGLDDLAYLDEDTLEDALDDVFPVSKDVEDLVDDMGLDELFVVTVEEDGKWYTSVSMTVAQYAWEEAGFSDSDLSDPITADERPEFDSPEASTAGLFEAWNDLASGGDIREFAAVLPEAESRLLAVYGPALVSEDDLEYVASLIEFSDFEGTALKTDGDLATVAIDNLVATLAAPDTDLSVTWTRDGDTISLAGEYEDYWGDYTDFELNWAYPDSRTYDFTVTIEQPYSTVDAQAQLSIPADGELSGEFTGSYEGYDYTEEVSGSFTYADGCAYVEFESDGAGGDQEVCLSDLGLDDSYNDLLAEYLTELPDPAEILSMTAIKGADGNWNTSLVASNLTGGVLYIGAVAGVTMLSTGMSMGGMMYSLESTFDSI
jgi:hypothetical protein